VSNVSVSLICVADDSVSPDDIELMHNTGAVLCLIKHHFIIFLITEIMLLSALVCLSFALFIRLLNNISDASKDSTCRQGQDLMFKAKAKALGVEVKAKASLYIRDSYGELMYQDSKVASTR